MTPDDRARLIAELGAGHQQLPVSGRCIYCAHPWPCPAIRGGYQLERDGQAIARLWDILEEFGEVMAAITFIPSPQQAPEP